MSNKAEESEHAIPQGWDQNIHSIFVTGEANKAIGALVEQINLNKDSKPKGLLEQLSYYLFLIKDYKGASHILESAHKLHPEDDALLINLGVALSRSQEYKKSIHYLGQYLKKNPSEYGAWDSLASNYYHINEEEKAARSGRNALILKDKKFGAPDEKWKLPDKPVKELTAGKKKVISFSLWGNEKRYIFGALRNLLLAPDFYPEWELWFYVDSSVSPGFIELIEKLGGRIILQTNNQNLREKLCWRFAVASEDTVGYFLVRDADSVFSLRECLAVQQWINSGKHFHILRDWWTHTDLILAGMWGGISGILPDIKKMIDNYSPNAMATPSIDQWFLRDCVWRYIKTSYIAHDRCFKFGNAVSLQWPLPEGNQHIGACEYHQRPEFQESILAAWLDRGRKKAEYRPNPLP
ncbi:tetratricopeptide repeat protein [Eionea flava]